MSVTVAPSKGVLLLPCGGTASSDSYTLSLLDSLSMGGTLAPRVASANCVHLPDWEVGWGNVLLEGFWRSSGVGV